VALAEERKRIRIGGGRSKHQRSTPGGYEHNFFSNQLRHFPIPQLAYHICDQNTILEKQQGAKISLSASCSSLRNFSGHYNVVPDRISFSERLMVGCFGCPYCNYQKLGDKQWL
jgi:hypothetical protein